MKTRVIPIILFLSVTVITISCLSIPSPFLPRLSGDLLYSIEAHLIHSPSWSPNGSGIAFNSTNPKTGRTNVYFMNLATSELLLLSEEGYFEVVSISKNDVLALDGIGGIYIVKSGDVSPRKVTPYGESAAWDPSGNKLAIFGNAHGSPNNLKQSLHIVDLDNNSDNIVFTAEVVEEPAFEDVSWSPDGRRIAFSMTAGKYSDGTNIYVLDLIDNKVSQVTNNKEYNRQPIWSPDGNSIAYLSSPQKSQATYVILLNLTYQCVLRSENTGWIDITWSPDGNYFVFTRDDSLYRIDLSTLFQIESVQYNYCK